MKNMKNELSTSNQTRQVIKYKHSLHLRLKIRFGLKIFAPLRETLILQLLLQQAHLVLEMTHHIGEVIYAHTALLARLADYGIGLP